MLAVTKLPKVMPGTVALVRLTVVTLLSVSDALTLKLDAAPCTALPSAQAVMIGALTGPTGEQLLIGLDVLRGVGVPVAKSALLLLVSVQPPASRMAAVVEVKAGVGVPSVADEFGP